MILFNSTIFAIIYIKLLSLPILGFNIMQCKNHCFAIIGMYFPLTVYICWIIFWIVRTCNVSMGGIINNQRSFIPAGVHCRYTNYCIWNYKMIGECRFVVNRKCTIKNSNIMPFKTSSFWFTLLICNCEAVPCVIPIRCKAQKYILSRRC